MSARPQVLIVDDDRFVRVTLRDCLSGMACDIREAANGARALEMVEEDPPALVLLDLMMPEVSGLEVLHRLKERGARSLVLVISSMDPEALIEEALRAGAAGFISKPFHPLEISMAVEKALSLQGGC